MNLYNKAWQRSRIIHINEMSNNQETITYCHEPRSGPRPNLALWRGGPENSAPYVLISFPQVSAVRIPHESQTFDTFAEACSKHSIDSLSKWREYRYIHRLMSERERTSLAYQKLS